MKHTWKKLTALLLVVLMLASALPFAALADDDAGAANPLKGDAVVLAIYKNGTTFPSEPRVHSTANYTSFNSNFEKASGSFSRDASKVLDPSIMNVLQSGIGANGVFSGDGLEQYILPESGIVANEDKIIEAMTGTYDAGYDIIWYVIKDQGVWGGGWHINGIIVHTDLYYVSYDANGGAGSPPNGVKDQPAGTKYTIEDGDDLSMSGYEFAGWNTEADGSGTTYAAGDEVSLSENLVLYAQWERALVDVTVEYYLEKADADGEYILSDLYGGTYSAQVGSTYTVEPEEIEGFRFNEELSTVSGEVTSNGLVLKLYYDIDDVPASEIVPAAAAYKVEYYFETEANDGTFEKDDALTEMKVGALGATVTAEAKDFEGYRYVAENSVPSATVEMPRTEGNDLVLTTLKLYYEIDDAPASEIVPAAAAYKVEYYFEQTKATGDYKLDETLTEMKVGELGATVTAAEKAFSAYKFNAEKSVTSGKVVMPTAGEDGAPVILTLKLYYDLVPASVVEPAAAAYKVEHYLQNTNGDYILEGSGQILFGEIGSTVSAEIVAHTNYKFNAEKSITSGTVVMPSTNAQGELELLTLKLYYDLVNTTPVEPAAAAYKVEYYFEQTKATGDYKLDETLTEMKVGELGATVTAAEKAFSAYKFNAEKSVTSGKVVMPTAGEDGAPVILTLKLYYDLVPASVVEPAAAVYVVEHYLQNTDGEYELEAEGEKFVAELGATVTAEIVEHKDYKFNAEKSITSGVVVLPTAGEDGAPVVLTLKLYYDLIFSTPVTPAAAAFKVEHYLEAEDGTYKLEEEGKIYFGAIGAEVEAEIVEHKGYVFNASISNVKGTVVMPEAGEDGAPQILTLRLYYDLEDPDVPDTGDNSNLMAFVIIALLAVSGIVVVAVLGRKSRV